MSTQRVRDTVADRFGVNPGSSRGVAEWSHSDAAFDLGAVPRLEHVERVQVQGRLAATVCHSIARTSYLS